MQQTLNTQNYNLLTVFSLNATIHTLNQKNQK